MRLKFYLDNPYYDFVLKGVLLMCFVPFTLYLFLPNMLFVLGDSRGYWDGEGILFAVSVAFYSILFSIIAGFILSLFIILFFNKKLMSGDRILMYNKGKRFLRFYLFLISLVLSIPLFGILFHLSLQLRIDLVAYYVLDFIFTNSLRLLKYFK